MRLILMVFTVMLIASCATQQQQPSLHLSEEYYNYLQPSYKQYLSESWRWLQQNRQYISDDQQQELDMNMPFELTSERETGKAVLLVHGLGDSPFTFRDLGRDLAAQGYHVQSLLLPGHGSKPSDLMLPQYADWQTIVDHYADMLRKQYDQVWLGGFSTGANLVTEYATTHPDIAGLLLFAPGFQSKAGFFEKLTPLAASLFDWGWKAKETNLVKYSSSPLNGAKAYAESAAQVRQSLKQLKVSVPTFMVISEDDSVLDVEKTKALFLESFEHPNNRVIWYGETPQEQNQITQQSMNIPTFKVSNASHMGIMFKPCNPYYGLFGSKRICENGLDKEQKASCMAGDPVWYSAYGHREDGKIHARLTWNPHYQDMLLGLVQVMNLTNTEF